MSYTAFKVPITANTWLCLFALWCFVGCTINRQIADTVAPDGTKQHASSLTLAAGDAKSSLDRTRASAGKTASVGANGLEQESNSEVLKEAVRLGKTVILP